VTLLSDQRKADALWKGFQRLTGVVLVLAVAIVVIAVHLIDRQDAADHRNEVERQAICSLIDGVPTAKSTPQLTRIRVAYQCGPPHAPFVVTSPSP
jgi:hypothetical protein